MSDKCIWSVLADVQDVIEQPKLNASVNYGNTKFRYADLTELWRVVRAATKGSGLFVRHTAVVDEGVTYICVIAHYGTESAELARVPSNLVGKPQDVGSSLTYARRYSLALAFGLSAEEDDDGQRGAGQSVRKPKTARDMLLEACAKYAAAMGMTHSEVFDTVCSRDDYVNGDDASYRAIAKDLLEAIR